MATSGCLTQAETYASADVMRTYVRVPDRFARGEADERSSASPTTRWETGLRTGPDGRTLPRRIIERLEVRLSGRPVLDATFHRSLAANPFLRFYLRPGAPGPLQLAWVEDTGLRAEAEAAAVSLA